MQALTRDECRPECEDGKHLDLQGNCVNCPQGTYRRQGQDLGCTNCPKVACPALIITARKKLPIMSVLFDIVSGF